MGWTDDIVLRASLRIIDEIIRQAGLLLAAIPYPYTQRALTS